MDTGAGAGSGGGEGVDRESAGGGEGEGSGSAPVSQATSTTTALGNPKASYSEAVTGAVTAASQPRSSSAAGTADMVM